MQSITIASSRFADCIAGSNFKEEVITRLSSRPPILGVVEEGVVTAECRVLPVDIDWWPVTEVTDLLVFVAVLQNEQITCGFALSLLFWIVSKIIEQIRECTCLQHTEHCVKGYIVSQRREGKKPISLSSQIAYEFY